MSRGVNKVILLGNIGKDPEARYSANGNPIATLSVATSDQWNDKQTGEQKQSTEWHRVVVFNKLAEIVRDLGQKGAKIYVEGQNKTRKWTDQQGIERYITEVVGHEIRFISNYRQKDNGYSNDPQE